MATDMDNGHETVKIHNYETFVQALQEAGFSMGGGNAEGIFALVPFSWSNEPADTPVRWHTGDPETDPWEWRMRVLEQREDIAYSKVFFRKSGYITEKWYPYFLAVRRNGLGFEEIYADGEMSHYAKRIYEIIRGNGALPVHGIKQLGGFGKEDASRFDRALVDLQMKLFITMCGRRQKQSKTGEAYGWSSTVLCTTEDFWKPAVFAAAEAISPEEGREAILEQVFRLNPQAKEKKVLKFITG